MGRAAVSKPEPTPLRGLHVLVVEDHDDSRFVVEASLRYSGALVTAVRSASEALDLVRKVTPDIVLADIAMPLHDGIWLLEQLRARQQATGHYFPVVALTASISRTRGTAFDEILLKPCPMERLCDVILRLTRREASGQT
jgi:CheY-like chemotaxis protein